MEDMAALDIALDSVGLDELNSLEAKTLLDTIDSLRELHVGEIVNLPQIIVVGDQSSGKSSVLEAISRVRFPTKGDLCTRFATELVLRQSPETKIGVRIDGATGTGSVSSQQFRRVSFDKDALPEIINEATEKMGIRVGGSKRFSKDILHVEIAGPDIYPVTLVDLPGFFHSETADQTWEDKQLVKELAESYMKQSKSIILAVVSANQNLANQIVVEEAKRFDPNRERTLGIITKPDLTAPGSQDEKKCLQLIKGQESKHKLKLGWYVLRNRPEGQENTTADDRDAEEEKFFQSGAWAGIIPTNRGITSLRKRLSKVLLEHIQKTLPGLIEEIESSLSARQRTLEQLGKPRSDPDELRTYLLEIAERFQRLARDGIDGRYVDDFFGDLYSHQGTRKLRALLRGFNRALHATLVSKGVDREIDWDDEEDSPFRDGGFWWLRKGYDAPEYLKPFLDLFKSFSNPTRISERELCKELEELAAANQGIEYPGLPNGSLGVQLFKMQIKPWRGIAEFYLDQVLDFAKAFVEDLFTHIIGADRQTINAVLVFYVGTFFEERRKLLKEKLQEILRPYDSAYGPPLDAEFHETLSRRAARREAGRVASWLEEEFPAAFADKSAKGLTHGEVKTAALFSGAAKASEFGTEKVIGMTMTHFQMSLRTFAENVVNLAAENCLISDLPTILTPSMVVRMNPERLVELAQESESVQAQRLECQHEASILRKGLEKCQKSRLHERTVLPRSFLNTPPSNSGSRSASSTETPNPGSTHPKESARPKSIFAEQSSSAGPSKSSTQNLFAVPASKTTPFGSFTSTQPSPAASSSAPQSGGLFSGLGQSSFSSRAPSDSSSLFNTGRDTARNGTPTQAPGPSLFDKSTPITNGAGTGSSLFSNPPAQTSLFKSSTSNNTQSGGFGSGH